MRFDAVALGVCLFLGLGQGQGTVYKLRASEWSCAPGASGVMIARGTAVNRSGQTLKNVRLNLFEVRIRPTQSQGTQCQLWFRSPDTVQIPTQVPE